MFCNFCDILPMRLLQKEIIPLRRISSGIQNHRMNLSAMAGLTGEEMIKNIFNGFSIEITIRTGASNFPGAADQAPYKFDDWARHYYRPDQDNGGRAFIIFRTAPNFSQSANRIFFGQRIERF